jgi:hypothetical protein
MISRTSFNLKVYNDLHYLCKFKHRRLHFPAVKTEECLGMSVICKEPYCACQTSHAESHFTLLKRSALFIF